MKKRSFLGMLGAAPAALAVSAKGEIPATPVPQPTGGPTPDFYSRGLKGSCEFEKTPVITDEKRAIRQVQQALHKEVYDYNNYTSARDVWYGVIADVHNSYSHFDSFKSLSPSMKRVFAHRMQEKVIRANYEAKIAAYKKALSIEGRLDALWQRLFGPRVEHYDYGESDATNF